jgi:thiol-disulfide isomerase/thioredoxin
MLPSICSKGVFFKFFSPYCPHCNAMAAAWTEFHQNQKQNVHVGSIDCTSDESSKLCEEFNIQRYPTLIYCPPRTAQDTDYACFGHKGERTADSFTLFYVEDYKYSREKVRVPKLQMSFYPQKSFG